MSASGLRVSAHGDDGALSKALRHAGLHHTGDGGALSESVGVECRRRIMPRKAPGNFISSRNRIMAWKAQGEYFEQYGVYRSPITSTASDTGDFAALSPALRAIRGISPPYHQHCERYGGYRRPITSTASDTGDIAAPSPALRAIRGISQPHHQQRTLDPRASGPSVSTPSLSTPSVACWRYGTREAIEIRHPRASGPSLSTPSLSSEGGSPVRRNCA